MEAPIWWSLPTLVFLAPVTNSPTQRSIASVTTPVASLAPLVAVADRSDLARLKEAIRLFLSPPLRRELLASSGIRAG